MYNYLPHPSNMRTTDHVLSMRIREGAAGYGVYMMLLELLRDAEGRTLVLNPAHLAYAINEPDVDLVERVATSYGLFDISKDKMLRSAWLDKMMAEYDAKRQAAVEAGKRGAAKRYGRASSPTAPRTEPTADPSAPVKDTPAIGGGMGSLKAPHANNTYNIDSTDNTNQSSKSRLLDLSWDRWSGEELYLIARQRGTMFSPLDREEAAIRAAAELIKPEPEYNPDVAVQIADAMGLSHEQYEVISSILEGGRIGTPRMREALRILNEWQSRTFRARYPFDHLAVKLLEL